VITEAFDLAPVRWVIHAVGPIYQGPQDAATLTSAYTQALARADEVGATSVAFPRVVGAVPLLPAGVVEMTWLARRRARIAYEYRATCLACWYQGRALELLHAYYGQSFGPAVGQHLTMERTGDDRVDLEHARNRQGPVIPG